MVTPRETHWPIEPHTRIKHLILRRYLDAWLPIMARYNGRILFVDGFSGPGRYTGGEEGSPLIAFRALLDHRHFQRPRTNREVVFKFIESREDREAALRQELERFKGSRDIPAWIHFEVVHGEFAPVMTEVLDSVERQGSRLAPTFAFIDPFGFAGVPLEVIARIVRNPRCECLFTFMYEAITRFIAHPEPAIQAHFDTLFGTAQWRELILEEDSDRRRDGIVDLYRHQLMNEAQVRYVRTFEMINLGNRTEYFLYFGTNSEEGLSKMKQAMWRTDPEWGQVFSDRTETAQLVLLEPTADLAPLRRSLQRRFRSHNWVRISQVEEFVLKETPYSEAIHLKRKTLKPMEQQTPPLIQVQRPQGKANRPGDYPPGTRIRFL